MISARAVPLNACFSIRDNRDHVSNVTEERYLQSENHYSPKISTEKGTGH
jgi:hypothetical protein